MRCRSNKKASSQRRDPQQPAPYSRHGTPRMMIYLKNRRDCFEQDARFIFLPAASLDLPLSILEASIMIQVEITRRVLKVLSP
jgi:hypothetical protein